MRALGTIRLFDVDGPKAERFAQEMRALHDVEIVVMSALRDATLPSDIVATCTASTRAFLGAADVSPGSFIAAVGADNEHKQEVMPELMRLAGIVVDDLEQCLAIGDLHHALEAGVLKRDDVRATLGEVIAGRRPGRSSDEEIVVFDSTGVAIEDVAAAIVVYERSLGGEGGMRVALDG